MKNYTDPLDYLTENANPLFGEGSVGEVTLPGDSSEEAPEFPLISGDDADFAEGEESAEHEAGESTDEETTEELGTLSSELEELKNKISDLKSKYPEDTDGEVAKALDDATSAIDLAVHHLGDIGEDLSTEEPEIAPEESSEVVLSEEEPDADLDLDEEDWDA